MWLHKKFKKYFYILHKWRLLHKKQDPDKYNVPKI